MYLDEEYFDPVAYADELDRQYWDTIDDFSLQLVYGHGTLVVRALDGTEFTECWCTDLLQDDAAIRNMMDRAFSDAANHEPQ